MKLVENGDFSHSFDAIAFQHADKLKIAEDNKPFSICYAIEENHWQNKVTIQLLIKDIKRP
jgi:single-stranded-DNA-specific exonuclease